MSKRRPSPTPPETPSRAPVMVVLLLILGALIVYRVTRPPAAVSSATVEAAIRQGRLGEAIALLEQAHRNEPEDAGIVAMLAELNATEKRYDEALEWIQRVPQFGSSARYQLLAAQFALQDSQIGTAESLLENALRIDPRLDEARRYLAVLQATLMRPHLVRAQLALLDQYGEATAQDVAHYVVGDRLMDAPPENIEKLEPMVERDADHSAVVATLAHNYALLDRADDARSLLGQHWKNSQGTERWRVALELAELSIAEGRVGLALQWLEELGDAGDLLPRTWIARGRVWRDQGEVEQAIAAFRNAAALDPFDPEPVFALSRLLQQQGDSEGETWRDRFKKLQRLNAAVEDALTLEEIQAESIPRRAIEIGRLLDDIGATREALLCLRWGVAQGQADESTQTQLAQLHSRADRARLQSPDHALLTTVPSAVSTDPPLAADRIEDSVSSVEVREETAFSLVDVTESLRLRFRYLYGDEGRKLLLTSLGGGVSVLDFDADGWPDLYLPQGGTVSVTGPISDQMDGIWQNLDGREFTDRSRIARLEVGGYSHGAAVGDYDCDGFPDVFVANYGRNTLYRNCGDGTFQDVTAASGLTGNDWSTSAVFADLDRDGDSDLYVVNYVVSSVADMKPCPDTGYAPCGPMDKDAAQDQLWENLGDGTFRLRKDAGIVVPDGKGLGVVAADLDNDRRLDLFVGNDTTANFLFRNQASTSGELAFTELGVTAGVAFDSQGESEACMGIAANDVDEDGLLDLIVTNFEDQTNTFYRNLGDSAFLDQTVAYGLGGPSFKMMGWGAQLIDLNADSWNDLITLNGDLHGEAQVPQLYANREGQRFALINSPPSDFLDQPGWGRGLATLDYDRDTRPDLIGTDQRRPVKLLANRADGGSYLVLTLIGRESARDAIGAVIDIDVADRTLRRQVIGGGGYLATNQRSVFIGCAEADAVDLRIQWPSGRNALSTRVSTGQHWVIVEGSDPKLLPM